MSSAAPDNMFKLPDEIAHLLEGEAPQLVVDPHEEAVTALLRSIRGQLVEAADEDSVSIREWARQLGVQPSVVSRQLRDCRDMKVSTAALLAHALGREWEVCLKQSNLAVGSGHNSHFSLRNSAPPVIMGKKISSPNKGPRPFVIRSST